MEWGCQKSSPICLGKLSLNNGKHKGKSNEIDSNVIIGKSFVILGDKIWKLLIFIGSL